MEYSIKPKWLGGRIMRIENGYLQQSMLCSKNNRNAVGNFSDTMNKAQECISSGRKWLCRHKCMDKNFERNKDILWR